jgi:glycosyltransferase involved in cell wall biosynthesis
LVENLPIARDHRLRKQAAALLAAGIGVTVICRSDPGNAAVRGIRLREYGAPTDAQSKLGYLREYGWSVLMTGWQMVRCLLSEGFDAVQVCSTPDIYFLVTVPVRMLGKPVVFDARDLSPEIYARRYGSSDGAMLKILRALERASYRSADQVLAVNESVAMVAHERGGVPMERVTVVGNGPVMRDVHFEESTYPVRNGSGHLCCWVGFMGPQDGVDLALRAVAHLIHHLQRTDAQFVFVGIGDALPALRQLATELGIDEWVSFPGWQDREDVAKLLQKAEVGLEPNLEDFVSPVKVMEYMAYALPTVAFDLRETRKILGGGGLFVPPGDVVRFAECVESLLKDPLTRSELGAVAHDRVRNSLAWEHQERPYLDLYRSLLPVDQPNVTLEMV